MSFCCNFLFSELIHKAASCKGELYCRRNRQWTNKCLRTHRNFGKSASTRCLTFPHLSFPRVPAPRCTFPYTLRCVFAVCTDLPSSAGIKKCGLIVNSRLAPWSSCGRRRFPYREGSWPVGIVSRCSAVACSRPVRAWTRCGRCSSTLRTSDGRPPRPPERPWSSSPSHFLPMILARSHAPY